MEVLEVMHCVLLCILEGVGGVLCLLEVMRCVLFCLLEVLEVPEVMCCMRLCLLEVLELPEAMRCVLGSLYAGGLTLRTGLPARYRTATTRRR